jgi:methylated-DNA-[protein]-cysteine S-methyltransferase
MGCRLFLKQVCEMTNKQTLNYDSCGSIDSPVGPVSVYAKDGAIVFLEMAQEPAPNDNQSPVVRQALTQLADYFAGTSRELNFPVLSNGTEFQQAVWAEIAKVPFGQTTTYAQIAERIGKPKASRAVGGAVGANPVPLVVGCHRVMGVSGKITGFSGGDGIPTKRWLLAHESIESAD